MKLIAVNVCVSSVSRALNRNQNRMDLNSACLPKLDQGLLLSSVRYVVWIYSKLAPFLPSIILPAIKLPLRTDWQCSVEERQLPFNLTTF